MDSVGNWLFPNTPVETLLKTRPLAMGIFERLEINPWKSLHGGVGPLIAEHHLPWQEFLRAMSDLPVPDPDSDWKSLPILHLLDHLVSQHREFLNDYLPAIGHVLSNLPDQDADSLQHLRNLAVEWPAFTGSLTTHLREEEDTLFLRLLRYDSCLRLGTAGPDFEGGSVRVFTVVRMLEHEHRDMALFRRFLAKALPDYPRPDGDALELRLRPVLREFEQRLGRHARLETDILFPWGISLEKALYDLHIRGKLDAKDKASALSRSTLG